LVGAWHSVRRRLGVSCAVETTLGPSVFLSTVLSEIHLYGFGGVSRVTGGAPFEAISGLS
jgi:hypothetical protein